MREETGFLRAILDNPEDEGARLIYADWLEESQDARAEYLRLDCALQNLPSDDIDRPELEKRLNFLAGPLDPKWLAVISRPAIENCDFSYLCPKQWEKLEATDQPTVRFCENCQKNVHYCTTVREARDLASEGHCVAVDPRQPRRPDDLETRPMLMGVIDVSDRFPLPVDEDRPAPESSSWWRRLLRRKPGE